MKNFLLLLTLSLVALPIWSQEVFTVVYATSDDGFVNVRSQPSMKGKVLTKLYAFHHGLGSGVLRGRSGNWSKVSVDKITGWAYNKYLGTQNWYSGKGTTRLVAAKDNTPLYGEDYSDSGERPLFTTVGKGTIIADEYQEEGDYYVLITAHDYLFIPKKSVTVEHIPQ
ncbi:MAG: SH3 domain-containing protein [Bacteroidaceae bacterium]|nr:SH3 domain-containing protein [Bacteroidaceae bacterium]